MAAMAGTSSMPTRKMKLVASRPLARFPREIATVGGNVVVMTCEDGGAILDAFDAELAPLWSKRLERSAVTVTANDQTLILFDSAGAWILGADGECLGSVKPQPRNERCLSAFACLPDGFVFAWEQNRRQAMRPPVIERVNTDGAVVWTTPLSVGEVEHEGVVQMRADEGWKARPKDPWVPESWISTARDLTISGDAVLACFSEMPRSGIGCGYVLSLTDGALRFTTRMGPIQKVAPLSNGEFLVGYQGYGTFETLVYARDGDVPERWSSHGHYVVDDDVRVIELENVLPSKMHLVRLLPGGEVTKGDWLDGYYTSRPLRDATGTIYFFRKGTLFAAQDLRINDQLLVTTQSDSVHSTKIVGTEHRLYFAHGQKLWENPGATLVGVDI